MSSYSGTYTMQRTMQRLVILFAMTIVLVSLKAQSTVEGSGYSLMLKTLLSHSVAEISVDSLALLINEVQLLDARGFEEYEVSHLNGAIHTGYDDYDSTIVEQLDKNKPIIVYCSIGYRSEKIAERLISAGCTDVYNLYGGIFEWVNQGQPVVNALGDTDKVHAYSRAWGIWLMEGEKVYE